MEYVECHGNCRLLSFSVAFSAQGSVLKAACQCAGDPQHSLQPAPGPPSDGVLRRPATAVEAPEAAPGSPRLADEPTGPFEEGNTRTGRARHRSNVRAHSRLKSSWFVSPETSANTADQSGLSSFYEMLR